MNKVKHIDCGGVAIGGEDGGLALIAGPCVIEGREKAVEIAQSLTEMAEAEEIPFIFKASYDKANRTSHRSYRGPGIEEGLEILAEIKEVCKVPILTDVHSPAEARQAAKVVDVIQIPAFLCRQTDLLQAAGETGSVVNIKKGQFLAPWDIRNVIAKVENTGNERILVTERGVSFGYNTLVADMRGLAVMREFGYPVVFDATHSVQQPGGAGDSSSGESRFAPVLARAAVATGCDAVFMETNIDPNQALSDKDNAVKFSELGGIWRKLRAIDEIVKEA